jgi:hypothetical protein
MFRSPRAAAVLRFAGGALTLCLLGLALLADIAAGSLGHQGVGVLLYLSAAAAGAVALPAVGVRLPGGPLAWAACGAALVSLACSARRRGRTACWTRPPTPTSCSNRRP